MAGEPWGAGPEFPFQPVRKARRVPSEGGPRGKMPFSYTRKCLGLVQGMGA